MPTLQYVNYGDTIADIAQTEKTSASLTATTSILLAVLLIISFLTNLLLVATILASYKLRNCLLYLMLCQLGIANAIDTLLIMFVSLLYVANGTWTFGDFICRANTWAQEFLSLYTFFIITLMAMERALGLTAGGRNLVTGRYALAFSLIFGTVAFCFAAPVFMSSFSVRPYPYRYLCAVGQAPLVYSIVQMVAFGGCIFVTTICFGALLRYNNIDRSLPARPQDYGAFIMESRALQDYMTHGRLVFFVFLSFVLIQGPYIVLNFFVQIRNSGELLKGGELQLEVSQDIDTLITWLRFFFPLIVTLLVFTTCHDIWIKIVNLVCCRRSNGVWTSQKGHNQQYDNRGRLPNDNVLTLVATTDGLQMRAPDGQFSKPPPIRCQWEEDTLSNFQENNQYEREETPSESKTHKVIHPKVLKVPSGFTSDRNRNSKIPRTKKPGQPQAMQPNNRTTKLAKKVVKIKKVTV